MKRILALSLATTITALAQSPAPRAEVAFRASKPVDVRPVAAAGPSDLGHEIMLMQESRPFIVRTTISPSYTTNAFSDYSEQSDWSLNGNLSIGVESLIAGKLLVHGELGTRITRYDKERSLNRDAFYALASVGYALTSRTSVSASYVGSWSMDEGYGANYLTTHTMSVGAGHRIPIGERASLSLSTSANFISADPSDYNQVVLNSGFALTFRETARIEWGLGGRVEWSDYESYFRGLFPEDRSDFSWTLEAWWNYRFSERFDLRVDARFSRNDSNLRAFDLARGQFVGLYDYNAWQFVPSVGVNWQF